VDGIARRRGLSALSRAEDPQHGVDLHCGVFGVLPLQVDHFTTFSSAPHPCPDVELPFVEVEELAIPVLVSILPFAFVSIFVG
jgi:hypothetical protein